MAIAVSPLHIYQWGREGAATPGTNVAATSKIAIERLDFEPEDAVYRPQLVKGLLIDNPGNELVISRGSRWTASGPVIYDQFHNWLEMLIQGGVSPTGTDPYTWVHTMTPTSVSSQRTFTFERRVTDGTNHIDNEWGYCMANEMTVHGAMDAPLRMDIAGFGRAIGTSTLTAALALPNIEIPPSTLTKVYIDTTWAGLGGTQVSAQVLSYNITMRNGAGGRRTADGRTELDFNIHTINGRLVGITADLLLLVKADSGQYATEKTAAEAQTLRAVRIQADGTSSKQIRIDFLAKHAMGSLYKVDEQDGFDVVAVNLVSTSDGTNAFKVSVVNAVSTLI